MGAAMSAINDAVAIYLFKNGKSRGDLADAMGMSRKTLRLKLSGESELTLSEVDKLCEITGVDISSIFDGRK